MSPKRLRQVLCRCNEPTFGTVNLQEVLDIIRVSSKLIQKICHCKVLDENSFSVYRYIAIIWLTRFIIQVYLMT